MMPVSRRRLNATRIVLWVGRRGNSCCFSNPCFTPSVILWEERNFGDVFGAEGARVAHSMDTWRHATAVDRGELTYAGPLSLTAKDSGSAFSDGFLISVGSPAKSSLEPLAVRRRGGDIGHLVDWQAVEVLCTWLRSAGVRSSWSGASAVVPQARSRNTDTSSFARETSC